MVLLGFESVDAALRAVQFTLPTGPAACELLDRRLLTLARGQPDSAALVVGWPRQTLTPFASLLGRVRRRSNR